VIIIPEEYTVQQLYEFVYKVTYNKYNHTYNGCCPFCKEGNSWGSKKRFYYIADKDLAFCHNCGYSKKTLSFLCELTNKPISVIINEIQKFDIEIQLPGSPEAHEIKPVTKSLPHDCINLTDDQQLNFYKDNNVVRAALHLIKTRRLDSAINRPKTFYISLTDKVHKDRLVLPFYNQDNEIIFYQTRTILHTEMRNKPKYLSKFNAEKSLYGIHNISSELDYIFIFEGPIDSFFMQNGIATCGITERGNQMFTELQREQLNNFNLYKKIFVLDNQWVDKAAHNKSLSLVDEGHEVFIWPKELRQFKDFNDICVTCGKDKIKPEFVLKHTHSGLKAKLLLTVIKNN